MKRISLNPRPGWQTKVESVGLTFHSPEAMAPQPYWDESAAYELTSAEVDTLEAAANTMQEMCLAAAQHIIDHKRYAELDIPAAAIPVIEAAWNAEPPALYGRFDFTWAGADSGQPPKLLEYNADTPTSLLEAAVVQWHWLEEVGSSLPTAHHFLPFTIGGTGKPDQFNSIHERLVAKWKDIAPYLNVPIYFAGTEEPEDILTLAYLQDTAQQAGLSAHPISMLDIGWNPDQNAFVDLDENRIDSIFKLYPWEVMMAEQFAEHALATYPSMKWIEPIWKMLLSNKGILPILWQLYPNHPNLLPAYFEGEGNHGLRDYVRKPLHSREGANVTLVRNGATTASSDGPYDGARIVQALAPDAVFDARYPVLGLWMIDQECGGMGIRESTGPITDNLSSFVPHFFR